MTEALVAVVGTLAGGLLTGLLQHRTARTGRTAARAEHLRQERLDAVTALAVALSDHRRAMWHVRHADLTAAPADRVRELRDESHRTRSALTSPAVRIRLLIPDAAVRGAAEAAVAATYALREAADIHALQRGRCTARDLHDDFVDIAGSYYLAAA